MVNPEDCGDAQAEWIEFVNKSGSTLDLNKLVIKTNSGEFLVTQNIPLGDGQTAVAYRDHAAQCYGFTGDIAYSSTMSLNNTNDTVVLKNATITIDQVAYGSFPVPKGKSLQLDSGQYTDTANDSGANWCPGSSPFIGAANDKASPTVQNQGCSTNFEGLSVGDVVITELMIDPEDCLDGQGEYIEIFNNFGGDLDLYGLNVAVGNATYKYTDTFVISNGDFAVLARSDLAACSTIIPDVIYGGNLDMKDYGTTVAVGNSVEVLDEVEYDEWWTPDPGTSLQLNNDVTDTVNNDDETKWCESRDLIAGGTADLGTPGGVNHGTWSSTKTTDANLGDWDVTTEGLQDSQGGPPVFVSWDATNIYVAIDHTDFSSPVSTKHVVMYFSDDTPGGTTTGVTVGTQTPEVNLVPKYALVWTIDDSDDGLYNWTGSVWNETDDWLGTAGSVVATGGNAAEFTIPKAAIGVTGQLRLALALVDSSGGESTYNAIPANGFKTDGMTDPDWDQFFVFSTGHCDPPNWSEGQPYINHQIVIDGVMGGAEWKQSDECFAVQSGGANKVCVTYDLDNVYIVADHAWVNDQANDWFNLYMNTDDPNDTTAGYNNAPQQPTLPWPMSFAVTYDMGTGNVPVLRWNSAGSWDSSDAAFFTTGNGDWARTGAVVEYMIPKSDIGISTDWFEFTSAFLDQTPSSEASEDPVPTESFTGPVLDPNYAAFLRFDMTTSDVPVDADLVSTP